MTTSRSDLEVKLRGEARFGADLETPGMLWGVLVPAPVAHGTIRSIDLTEARRVEGAVAIDGREMARLFPGPTPGTRPLFPVDEVTYRNQPVAAVAAPSLAAARRAARAVQVDVAPLPVALDIDSIFPEFPGREARHSPHVNTRVHARFGDVDAAFRSASLVVSETYRTSGVQQVAIEPHACLARVEGGEIHMETSTQSPFGVRDDLASRLGVPESAIDVEGTWVGGGFGGKAAAFLEPYAAGLAAAAGRPVKMTLSYREEFLLGRSTLPAVVRIESAVHDGRLTGRRVRLLLDTGDSLPGRDFATGFAIAFLAGPYRLPAVELEGYAVRTNKPPFGPHRAPFAPQCAFVVESHMDAIARRLHVDPIAFRITHALREGDTTALGQRVGPFGLVRALEIAARVRDEWRREASPGRGIGLGCGFWSTGTGAGGEATVRLTPTELVIVEGEREIGNGSIVRGLPAVAARVLPTPSEAIRVEPHSTRDAPFDSGVYGSRTVGALGQAVEKAVRQTVEILRERWPGPDAEIRLELERGELVAVRGRERRTVRTLLTPEETQGPGLETHGRHFGAEQSIDDARVLDGTFYPYTDFTATVHLAEVSVDRETGRVRVERSLAVQDVGVAIDPEMVRAQVEGGAVMGLGTALTEETLWNDEGRMLNPGLLDYRIPTLAEVPPIRVELVEGFAGAGPFGAKGVGEPPIIPVAAAVSNAVSDATGAEVRELPLTPERVARALMRL
ncbi:MAG TPA: xanthine dehydrogenase family protein molybdopterin-binding subunit [Thermoplasmata archaeon]|nr:xanthine dehydrogenase family protein molybdopterin-binding subunit [Thermoplasmata archaeon]